MSQCDSLHWKHDPKGNRDKKISCYYIAGNCISRPENQGGFEAFLRATYPYYHGATYELSKTLRMKPIQP